tara:strand:+ start:739 stop:1371 length:633 start_codon:yes stop_codon:yes gene_type:complete
MTIRLIKKPQDIKSDKKKREESFWCWYNEIEKDICDKIILSAKDASEWQTGKVGYGRRERQGVVSENRKTDVYFNNQNWIYDLVIPYMKEANKNAGWNFDISGMESYQIGRYSSDVSGHYDWHQDSLGTWNNINETSNKHLRGKTRKLSMSLILNDDYEGGEFETWSSGKKKFKKGSMIFFPSWVLHKVNPVTKGTRYSLVVWFSGAPFR